MEIKDKIEHKINSLFKVYPIKYYTQLKDEPELLTRTNPTILNGWKKLA